MAGDELTREEAAALADSLTGTFIGDRFDHGDGVSDAIAAANLPEDDAGKGEGGDDAGKGGK